ncbi:MAG TPA: YebC/PmpR family DNA-binding transcriptional regulator [Candidatus Andersenbacteria bacterium]|nr:YebC/PmpR family DNA-binding transcriptional regulator [Candidatus Andersenbacteria bacterium]
MSGHSKWHQIKRKKEVTDAKRAQLFTRLAAQIKQAAAGGSDPATNAPLADAIARARRANMPQTNIDRLIGNASEGRESVVYEAFGPAGIALLITAQTDNSRRTVAELRAILKDHNGQLATPHSVTWKFKQRSGIFTPLYPLHPAPEAQRQLEALLAALTNHPDIEQVFTDVVE